MRLIALVHMLEPRLAESIRAKHHAASPVCAAELTQANLTRFADGRHLIPDLLQRSHSLLNMAITSDRARRVLVRFTLQCILVSNFGTY